MKSWYVNTVSIKYMTIDNMTHIVSPIDRCLTASALFASYSNLVVKPTELDQPRKGLLACFKLNCHGAHQVLKHPIHAFHFLPSPWPCSSSMQKYEDFYDL